MGVRLFKWHPVKQHLKSQSVVNVLKGEFWGIFQYLYSTLLKHPPSDSTVSEDAGIEKQDCCNFLYLQSDPLTTRLDPDPCMMFLDNDHKYERWLFFR